VAAGGDHVLLPGVLGRVDAVVGGDDAGAVIDGEAAQLRRRRPADDPADVLGDEQIEFPAADHLLELGQLGPVEPLALALGGDDPCQAEPSRWNVSAVNSKLWAVTRASTASPDGSFGNVNRRSARLLTTQTCTNSCTKTTLHGPRLAPIFHPLDRHRQTTPA